MCARNRRGTGRVIGWGDLDHIAAHHVEPLQATQDGTLLIKASGNVFENVYLAVWKLVEFTEMDAMNDYILAANAAQNRAKKGLGEARQLTKNIFELYFAAAEVHDQFSCLIRRISHDTESNAEIPSNLKKIVSGMEQGRVHRAFTLCVRNTPHPH